MTKWLPGIVTGSLTFSTHQNAYFVRFIGEPVRTFSLTMYGDLDSAYEAARQYRRETCIKNGATKNDYRFVNGYIEFKLQNDMIAKIDIQDFPKLVNVFHAKPGNKGRYYAYMCVGKNTKHSLHSLIYPGWEEVDHINRDGLDNRRCNLRNGKKGNTNVLNQSKRKDNTSGKTGVHFEKSSQCWKVQWPEDGKRRKRSWSANKYGMEGARQLAVQFRVELDERLGITNGYDSDCEDRAEAFPETPTPEYTPTLYRSNTSGVHGVRFDGKKWVASWSINGKRGSKTYSLKEYGEEARELAIQARLAARPQSRGGR